MLRKISLPNTRLNSYLQAHLFNAKNNIKTLYIKIDFLGIKDICDYGPHQNVCSCGREQRFEFFCEKSEQLQNAWPELGWEPKCKRKIQTNEIYNISRNCC